MGMHLGRSVVEVEALDMLFIKRKCRGRPVFAVAIREKSRFFHKDFSGCKLRSFTHDIIEEITKISHEKGHKEREE